MLSASEKMYEMRKQVFESNISFYDYIANNGYEFTKDELISIIKELDFALYHNTKNNEDLFYQIEEDCLNNLCDDVEE